MISLEKQTREGKENITKCILQYINEALLNDCIDFQNEDIYHSQLIEKEALKNSRICRNYAKQTASTETYFILKKENECVEAHSKQFSYGIGSLYRGHGLYNLSGEELCLFDENDSEILQQALSIIEINGEKMLCLKVSSFYPYKYISYLMRQKVMLTLCRVINCIPNLINDIIENYDYTIQKKICYPINNDN